MEWWNLWVPFIGTLAGIYVNYRISKKNSEESKEFQENQRTFQKEMTQKQIDANLKAQARIEWISDVRELVAEYISELSVLQQILFQMIIPVETIQIENRKEKPRQQIIDENLEKIEPLLEKLNSQRMKITSLSEKILLFLVLKKTIKK